MRDGYKLKFLAELAPSIELRACLKFTLRFVDQRTRVVIGDYAQRLVQP